MRRRILLILIIATLLPAVSATPPIANSINQLPVQDRPLYLAASPATLQQNLQQLKRAAGKVRSASENDEYSHTVQHVDTRPAIPSEREREKRGYRLFQTDLGQLRFEAYMGQQPTTGYLVEITEVVRYGDILNIGVRFHPPDSAYPVADRQSYPAAAVEFTVPNDTYRVNVQIEEQKSTWFTTA